MILGLDYADPERLILILLLIVSILLVIREKTYALLIKYLKIIPRIYLIIYYIFVTFNWYPNDSLFVSRGLGSAYGLILLFIAEVYLQWANKIYGRK